MELCRQPPDGFCVACVGRFANGIDGGNERIETFEETLRSAALVSKLTGCLFPCSVDLAKQMVLRNLDVLKHDLVKVVLTRHLLVTLVKDVNVSLVPLALEVAVSAAMGWLFLNPSDNVTGAFSRFNAASSGAQRHDSIVPCITFCCVTLYAPVITEIEKPVVVLRPSGPSRRLSVLASLVLGLVLGVGLALGREVVGGGSTEDQAKWAEVRRSFRFPWRRAATPAES